MEVGIEIRTIPPAYEVINVHPGAASGLPYKGIFGHVPNKIDDASFAKAYHPPKRNVKKIRDYKKTSNLLLTSILVQL